MSPNNAKSYIISDTKWCKIVHSEQQLQYLYKYYTLILNTQYSIIRMYVCCCCYAILARENGRALWYWNFVIILWSRGYFWYQFVSFFLLQKPVMYFFHALYHHDFHNLVKSGVSGVVVLLRLFGGNNSTYRG